MTIRALMILSALFAAASLTSALHLRVISTVFWFALLAYLLIVDISMSIRVIKEINTSDD